MGEEGGGSAVSGPSVVFGLHLSTHSESDERFHTILNDITKTIITIILEVFFCRKRHLSVCSGSHTPTRESSYLRQSEDLRNVTSRNVRVVKYSRKTGSNEEDSRKKNLTEGVT